jgi:hypothetical protein
MSENTEPLYNAKKLEEIKNKEEANRYLELGWKLLKIAEERETDEGGYYNAVIYCVGWFSSEEPKYPGEKKIKIKIKKFSGKGDK